MNACPLDQQKESNINDMLSHRTDYYITQKNGQRLYQPIQQWTQQPKRGSEVFIGRIPRDCYEDELVPMFEKTGIIYKLRLMMDFSGNNRGFAFLTYSNPSEAKNAVNMLDGTEIRIGHSIGVMLSWDNRRLYIGGIPRNKTENQILIEMKRVTEGVRDVIVYLSVNTNRNRGFAFVEYESHYEAAMAKRLMIPKFKLWNFHIIRVDWAYPEQEIDEETLKTIQVLHVRNLDEKISDNELKDLFIFNGLNLERVKRIKNFAFIHYENRNDAEFALQTIQSQKFLNSNPQYKYIHASWARPKKNIVKKRLFSSISNTKQMYTNITPKSMKQMRQIKNKSSSMTINPNDYQMQCLSNQTILPQIIPINVLTPYDYTNSIPYYSGYVRPLQKSKYY